MPSLFRLYAAAAAADAAAAAAADASKPSATERFTHALVRLTRTIWHPGCTFDTAIGAISEAAADALQIERVSVWHYDPPAGRPASLPARLLRR